MNCQPYLSTKLNSTRYHNVKEINYRSKDIIVIPDSLLKYKNLEILLLGNNPELNLKKTLKKLSKLPHLKEISLTSSIGNELPSEIALLENLESIDISHNSKMDVDKTFENLSKLNNLKIVVSTGNHLNGQLPSNICKIKSLEKLYLHRNRLETLPDCISELPNLKGVGLAYGYHNLNNIIEVLAKSNTVNNIDTLGLAGLSLDSLPESIGKFKNLKYLDLYENDIKTLPCSIMGRGITIDVEGNRNFKKPDCPKK